MSLCVCVCVCVCVFVWTACVFLSVFLSACSTHTPPHAVTTMAVMNNPAHCVTIFLVLMFTAEAHVIFNETFQDSSYQSDFTLDYSWDQHPHASPKYFDIAGAPQGSGNALRISIHADDKPFIKGNPTCPRTELAGNHEGYFLHDGTAYVAQWYVSVQAWTHTSVAHVVFALAPGTCTLRGPTRKITGSAGHRCLVTGTPT